MKKTHKSIVGAALLATPFTVPFLVVANEDGLLTAVIAYAVAATIAGCVIAGICLLTD